MSTVSASPIIQQKISGVHGSMKQRCNNPNHPSYGSYGGRGIKVCKEWDTLKAFTFWAISSGYEIGLTIDRIDNDKGYSPINCRWVTRLIQASNKGERRKSLLGSKRHSKSERQIFIEAKLQELKPFLNFNKIASKCNACSGLTSLKYLNGKGSSNEDLIETLYSIAISHFKEYQSEVRNVKINLI